MLTRVKIKLRSYRSLQNKEKGYEKKNPVELLVTKKKDS